MAKDKQGFKDDGRVVANMNVEGMPWNLSGPIKPSAQKILPETNPLEDIQLTKGEKRALLGGALAIILPIAALFAVGYFALFLFMDLVWLS